MSYAVAARGITPHDIPAWLGGTRTRGTGNAESQAGTARDPIRYSSRQNVHPAIRVPAGV